MQAKITVLPGDGVGPEVTRAAVAALTTVAQAFGHQFSFETHLIGGAAIDQVGKSLPDQTFASCVASDAVLLGPIGAPQYSDLGLELRPETGLLTLRKRLNAFANLRPVYLYDALVDLSPLKPELVRNLDLLFVRELIGGVLFGEPRELTSDHGLNTMVYTATEVERIARVAFEFARTRRRSVISIDKANVLEASQLWRRVVTRVARDYPDVSLEHAYVDSFAMTLVMRPLPYDVVVIENMFGDILTDESAALTGVPGMLPSATLGGTVALYETVQGSLPQIAGRDIVNPIGAIASAGMMLRHSFKLESEASAIEMAIRETLDEGYGTPDLGSQRLHVGTVELSELIREKLLRM